jgi:hypothetical protein
LRSFAESSRYFRAVDRNIPAKAQIRCSVRLVPHNRWTRSHFFFSFELSYLRALRNDQGCQDLEAFPEYDQKALEVRTPLVQNGADEHGPDGGDITVEWAHFGRLNRVTGNNSYSCRCVAALARFRSCVNWRPKRSVSAIDRRLPGGSAMVGHLFGLAVSFQPAPMALGEQIDYSLRPGLPTRSGFLPIYA